MTIEREARRGRVEIDHRLAPVELVEHRREGLVAGILVDVVGRQRDAVGVERVVGVFDLAQAALDVRQRQRREMAEAALVVRLHLRRRPRCIRGRSVRDACGVAEPDARRRDRQHRHRDAVLVHRLDGLARVPFGQPVVEGVGGVLEHVAGLLDVGRRIGVVVGVDAVRRHASTRGNSGAGSEGIEQSRPGAYQFRRRNTAGGGLRPAGSQETAHDHRRSGSGHQGGAERDRARARSALPRGHVGAGASTCTPSSARRS